jgi:hypothetical protein
MMALRAKLAPLIFSGRTVEELTTAQNAALAQYIQAYYTQEIAFGTLSVAVEGR